MSDENKSAEGTKSANEAWSFAGLRKAVRGELARRQEAARAVGGDAAGAPAAAGSAAGRPLDDEPLPRPPIPLPLNEDGVRPAPGTPVVRDGDVVNLQGLRCEVTASGIRLSAGDTAGLKRLDSIGYDSGGLRWLVAVVPLEPQAAARGPAPRAGGGDDERR